jgi:hypothetical protein
MQAIEFETQVNNGMIKIPEKYREFAYGKLKIIMLKQSKDSKHPDKNKISDIKGILKEIREKNIFQKIDNPVDWQRTIRNEWQ